MPAADEVLKIQLPSNISRFTFTLETKHLGPMPTHCPCKSPADAKEDPANAELMLLPTLSSTVSSTFVICNGQPMGGNFIKAGMSAVSLIDKTPIEESEMEPESDDGTGIPTQALIDKFWVVHGSSTGKCPHFLSIDSFAEEHV
ncbi:hypothetical protein J3A83DRAFT_4187313 [Scleroderma citrinum]